MSHLTEEQQRIIAHVEGPAVVLAEAGSGKTTTILHRIKRLVAMGVPPSEILMVTFARAGAEHMRRAGRRLGVPRGVTYRTLHSVGRKVINESLPLEEGRSLKFEGTEAQPELSAVVPLEGQEPQLGKVPKDKHLAHEVEHLIKHELSKYKNELPIDKRVFLPRPKRVVSVIGLAKAHLIWPDLIDMRTGELIEDGGWEDYHGTHYPAFQDWIQARTAKIEAEALSRCYMALEKCSRNPEYWSSSDYYQTNARRWITFDDMVALSAKAVLQFEPWVEPWRGRFGFVIVDEAQDNSLGNWVLVQYLVRNSNLMAVGDLEQSIYKFRGAEPELMRHFATRLHFHKGHEVKVTIFDLSVNFRSSRKVVEAANNLLTHVPHRFKKTPALPRDSALPGLVAFKTYSVASDEAASVAEKIEAYLEAGVQADNVAVLYRTNSCMGSVELELVRRRIPYRVQGSPFFRRGLVAATLGYVGCVVDPENKAWLGDCYCRPLRGLSRAFLRQYPTYSSAAEALDAGKLENYRWKRGVPKLVEVVQNTELALQNGLMPAMQHLLFNEGLLEHFLDSTSGTEEDEVHELAERLLDIGSTFEDPKELLDYVQTMQEERLAESDGQNTYLSKRNALPRVVLSTIHKAKGLEWSMVFMIHVNEGVLPLPPELGDPEEERRICYVGLTRAKTVCEISSVELRRTREGTLAPCEPSSFIPEIKEALKGSGLLAQT